MKAAHFRRIALGMQGAIERAHMGHPDFRVNNRIFATLHADMLFGMVQLKPEQQERFLGQLPDAFAPEAGAWGRSGSTRVRLDAIDEETLGEAMTLAWQNAIDKGPTKSRKSKKPARRIKPRPKR